MNLQSIARALGGLVSNGQVLAPGPGHSKHDRSMSVFIDPNAPNLIRVHSHAGDDWRACRDHVRARLGVAHQTTRDFLRDLRRTTGAAVKDDGAVARTVRALIIWSEARIINGTPGVAYLAKRGVDLGSLPDLRHVLRWHPACPWERGRHGAMIALMTDAITGEPRAIHRTAVTATAEKVGKMMLGPSAGCVVRLWPDEDVSSGLVVGEGIETVLVAASRIVHRGTRLAPAWAACSAGAMAKLPLLTGVDALTLLVDHDANNAGKRAAAECSARWTAAGREVVRLTPRAVGQDFGDLVGAA